MKDRGSNRPAPPIRYGPVARVVDWWSARSDARAGLPSVEGMSPTLRPALAPDLRRRVAFTPKLERLRHSASDAIEHELLRLERERSGPARTLATVRQEIPAAETVVATARTALADATRPLGEADLIRRRGGETRTDEAVVRRRRQTAHAERVARCEAALAAAEREMLRLRSIEAGLVESIRRAEIVAAIRARRIHEHTWRRISAYWQHLVRRHPAGAALNAVLDVAEPDLPAWALGDPTTTTERNRRELSKA